MSENDEMRMFICSDCVISDEYMYFVDTFHGIPARMSLATKDVEYIKGWQNYTPLKVEAVDKMAVNNNMLYLLTRYDGRIYCVDMSNNYCTYLEIPKEKEEPYYYTFFDCYNDELVIISKKKIFIVNKNNEIKEMTYESDDEYVLGCRRKNEIWIFPENGKSVMCYELETKEYQIFSLDDTLENCVSCDLLNDEIYLLTYNGSIYLWDIISKKMQLWVEDSLSKGESVGRIVAASTKMILLPAFGNTIFELNYEKKTRQSHDEEPEDFQYFIQGGYKYYGYVDSGKYRYFTLRSGNYFLKVNKENGEIEYIKPKLPSISELFDAAASYGKNEWKESDVGLLEFILQENINSSIGETGKRGKRIWGEIKGGRLPLFE